MSVKRVAEEAPTSRQAEPGRAWEDLEADEP